MIQPRNVILVVFDTLRRDAVGCYRQQTHWGADFPPIRTPHLDAFAERSIRLDRAYPEVLPTLPARRSLYTAQRVFPFREKDRQLKGDFVSAPGWGPIGEDQDTLAELFAAAGYRTGLVSDLYHQFKPSKNFARGFDQWEFVRGQETDPARSGPRPTAEEVYHYIPRELLALRREADFSAGIDRPPRIAADMVANFYGRQDDADWTNHQVFDSVVRWLQQNQDARSDDEGIFLTVECFDPHEPWFVPSRYRREYDDGTTRENVLTPYAELEMSTELLRRTRANYAGLVTMVDQAFGLFVDELERGGWLDDSIVLVVSDHGHSLLERGYMGKRGYPAEPTVFQVPALVRLPGGESGGRTHNGFVQHHDLAATMLDAANITPPQGIDGRSILGALSGSAAVRDHVVVGWGPGVLVVDDDWWLSIKTTGDGALLYPLGQVELPDEPSVAEEQHDVVERLFGYALDAAAGAFPDHILDLARRREDAPGCSPLTAAPVGIR